MKLIYTYEYCISGFPGAKKVKKMSITFCHSLCHCLLIRENVKYVGKCNEALHMNISHIQSRPTYCISILGSS